MKCLVVCLAAMALAACAQGGNAGAVDAATKGPTDASKSEPADAAVSHGDAEVSHDAAVAHDAAVQHDAATVMPDAGGGDGTICSGNDQCAPGYCCFIALCVEGTALGAVCLPSD